MTRKKIYINEGQWFAVPLRNGGYALGVVVRGNSKSVCLGYFFGPRYEKPPNDEIIWMKKAEDAILITQFGDQGLTNSSWPLIQTTRPFSREEWPIPKFGVEIPFSAGKGFVREYEFNDSGEWRLLRETLVDAKDVMGMPSDSLKGGGSVEVTLTKLLEKKSNGSPTE